LAAVVAAALLGVTIAAAPVVLHVVPPTQSASDSVSHGTAADGSATAPFRTVAAARDALRSLQPLPAGGAEVLLHGGTHAPFELAGPADSGRPDAPIVYAAAPGERALVSGGLLLPGSAFAPWSGGAPGVLRADLSTLGLSSAMLGGMRTPAGTMKCVGDCQHDKSELYLGGVTMTLARYPNKDPGGGWHFLKADRGGTFGRISAETGGPWFLMAAGVGLYPIATLQSSSTTLYQVSHHNIR
jgi:hypothetical protein